MKGCFLFRKALALVFLALLALHGSDRARAQASSSYLLLNNASATGPVTIPPTGLYQFNAKGTFGGATVALVVTTGYGSIANTLWTGTSAPSAPVCVSVPAGGSIQATVAGGSPSGLTATLDGVGSGGCGAVNANVTITTQANISTTVTPTITATSYTSGFCEGGLETFLNAAPSNGSGYLQSVEVGDVSGQNAATDIVVFNANPTNSTFTDHAACTVNSADLTKIIATVHVTDWSLFTTTGNGQALQLAAPFALGNANTTLYAIKIARGTPTYIGTTNIKVTLNVSP